LMLVAGFNLPFVPASFASPASLPLPLFLGAIVGDCGVSCRRIRYTIYVRVDGSENLVLGMEVLRWSESACRYVIVAGASCGSCELECGAVAWAVRGQ
jgi:hypothetical protein